MKDIIPIKTEDFNYNFKILDPVQQKYQEIKKLLDSIYENPNKSRFLI